MIGHLRGRSFCGGLYLSQILQQFATGVSAYGLRKWKISGFMWGLGTYIHTGGSIFCGIRLFGVGGSTFAAFFQIDCYLIDCKLTFCFVHAHKHLKTNDLHTYSH